MNEKMTFADFEDPNRCSLCREPISEGDQKNGLILHIKVSPVAALHPDTGAFLGLLQPDGPKNRYLHARPCGERYAHRQLVCIKCNGWRAAENGGTLCLCRCHPRRARGKQKSWPGFKNDEPCEFYENDLERARGL